jgi:GNAT superfamily N-acetyltransferase
MSGLAVRPASPADASTIYGFIRELAEYEKLLDQVEATEDGIAAALFGPSPRAFCDVAERGGQAIGFALWFYNFSTFAGRHGIWLEDLYVRPEHRGCGAGKALLGTLAKRCLAEGLSRLEWSVLDWNAPAIGFYDRIGAAAMDEWTTRRLSGDALRRLAGG